MHGTKVSLKPFRIFCVGNHITGAVFMQKLCVSFINHTMNQSDTGYVMLSPGIKAGSEMPRASQERCQEIRLGYISSDQALHSSSSPNLRLILCCPELCGGAYSEKLGEQREQKSVCSCLQPCSPASPGSPSCRGSCCHSGGLSGLSPVTQEGSTRLRKFRKG